MSREIADLDRPVAVGFGIAEIWRDDEVVFREGYDDEHFRYLREFEDMAKVDSDHDWRCILEAPLWMNEFQRQAPGEWVLVRTGPGFA